MTTITKAQLEKAGLPSDNDTLEGVNSCYAFLESDEGQALVEHGDVETALIKGYKKAWEARQPRIDWMVLQHELGLITLEMTPYVMESIDTPTPEQDARLKQCVKRGTEIVKAMAELTSK